MFNRKPKFKAEVYQDAKEEWRWRIVSTANGKSVGCSGEGYHNYNDCYDILKKQIKRNIPITEKEK